MLDGSVAAGSFGSVLGDELSGEDGGMLESGLLGVVDGVELEGSVLDGAVLEELLLEELVSDAASSDEALPVLPVSVAPAAEAERERSQ